MRVDALALGHGAPLVGNARRYLEATARRVRRGENGVRTEKHPGVSFTDF